MVVHFLSPAASPNVNRRHETTWKPNRETIETPKEREKGHLGLR
jgi:hypothetical protein